MSTSRQKPWQDIAVFRSLLKDNGLKATRPRLAVHQAMMELVHASADMVCEYINANLGGGATVASVYNVLTQMASLGIYNKRLGSGAKMYFDVITDRHIHLYDAKNNTYIDIFDEEMFNLVESKYKRRRFKGYKVDYFEIQLVGHQTRKQK